MKSSLTVRSWNRVLKAARTIANLDGAGGVRRVHIAEALSYRHRPASGLPAALGKVRAR